MVLCSPKTLGRYGIYHYVLDHMEKQLNQIIKINAKSMVALVYLGDTVNADRQLKIF